jgi:sigma-E factor negative regulatory protein RseA
MVMDRISALMDGELEDQEAKNLVARLKMDPALRICWDEFHLVRDSLRGEPLLSARFNVSLAQRLAEEPTVLAPQRGGSRARRLTTYAMSAAASLSAAALVAWVAVNQSSPESAPFAPQATNAAPASSPASVPAPVTVALPNEPSEGRMNDYLLAHQRFSPSTALQGLAPYIRTVSVTRTPERR